MIKNRLKHKAAGILAAFLITVSMAGTVLADPLPEETTPPEETTATEPSETTPEETQPVEPQETVIPEETGEPTEYGFGLTPTGNMALQDDISGEEAEAQSLEFLTVTTRDNHTFYIVIEHTKNGDNVHFLNQVDDADLRAVLSDEQIAEYSLMKPDRNLQKAQVSHSLAEMIKLPKLRQTKALRRNQSVAVP
jgi:hypothetical protein